MTRGHAVKTDAPTIDIIATGEPSDQAIEALARLLLAAEQEEPNE